MNWRRLRNMKPVVDEALGQLAMDGRWRTLPMKLDLGVLLVNAGAVRVDEQSYFTMEKSDNCADLDRWEKAWNSYNKKRASVLGKTNKKREKLVAAKSPSCMEKHALVLTGTQTNAARLALLTKRMDRGRNESEKENKGMAGQEKNEGKTKVEDEDPCDMMCEFCEETPCVWITKKEDMLDFDDGEHDHLPTEDWPPNNVRRRKVYRQMTLFINEGPMGKGVRKQLPKCVENGCRECFPSSVFMGFKDE
jgi:hypothetical protein